jgi:hypothetical protein
MSRLSAFIGSYDVERVIEDRRAAAQSRFDGRAVLYLSSTGAVYRETGALILNDQRFHAERSYLWHEDTGRIWVRFADGRDFHDFDPKIGGLASAHLCGADMYRGGYELSDWPRWSVTWDVSGPRKDYRSITTYVPTE